MQVLIIMTNYKPMASYKIQMYIIKHTFNDSAFKNINELEYMNNIGNKCLAKRIRSSWVRICSILSTIIYS
jgi:hypothetical protein